MTLLHHLGRGKLSSLLHISHDFFLPLCECSGTLFFSKWPPADNSDLDLGGDMNKQEELFIW